MSSGWFGYWQHLIQMTYGHCSMSSGWHPYHYPIQSGRNNGIWTVSHADDHISSGWLIADALSHPDDLAGVGISYWLLTANSLCHLVDIPFHLTSSGWHNWGWYLILMCYYVIQVRYASFLKSFRWDSKFRFFTTHGGPQRFCTVAQSCI